jgi:hypothetical protein
MSANANVLGRAEMARSLALEASELRVEGRAAAGNWKPEGFAKDQILALVRRVFLSSVEPPCHHVVLSPAEVHCNVSGICGEVALALSQETSSSVAWLVTSSPTGNGFEGYANGVRSIKSCSSQLSRNLWRVPVMGIQDRMEKGRKWPHWPTFLCDLRSEFEFAVIQSPTAAIGSDTAFLAQLTDGIILVLSARRTRKATARSIKEMLEGNQCRILGTVLCDRTFPLPERIYRRL